MTQTFQWQLCYPHTDTPGDRMPRPREAPGGILCYRNRLYMFGGGTLKYGRSSGQGNKRTLGALNDLWTYDPAANRWRVLEPDTGAQGFDPAADRPCARMLPAWVEVNGIFYLFGGLCILGEGWKFTLLNDLWAYDPAAARWELLEPDDGTLLEYPDCIGNDRPTTIGGFGCAGLGNRIYLFGGWGHRAPLPPTVETAVLSRQLWCYDTQRRAWQRPTPTGTWPPKRYVSAMTAWGDKLYIWGGRDTQDRDPQFYNDLWEYHPAAGRWTCLQPNRPGAPDRPSARYGMGSARIGDRWYIFGGFGPDGDFLPEEVNGPQLNDLWCFDLTRRQWQCIQPYDGSKDYAAGAARPGVRRVPGMVARGDAIYLFGGLDLASGPDDDGPVVGFNDLWMGRSASESAAGERTDKR